MNTPTDNLRMLLELYADGELDAAQRAEVERELESNAAARHYLDTLMELHVAAQTPFDVQAATIDFDRISANVMAAVATDDAPAATRDAELELLAMSRFDGETLSDADNERVDRYVQRTPEAQHGLRALAEVRDAVRLPVEHAADKVDFGLLSGRIMRAIEREEATPQQVRAHDKESVWQRVSAWFSDHRAMSAGFAGACVALAIALPITLSQQQEAQPTINNYYVGTPSVNTVGYEPGHWGSIRPGDDMNAPVVWIEADSTEQIPALQPALETQPGQEQAPHDANDRESETDEQGTRSPHGI